MSNLSILNMIQQITPTEIRLHPSELAMASEAFLKINEGTYSPTTIGTYKTSLQLLINETQGNLSTASLLRLRRLMNDSLGPRTVNKYLSCYRSFFSFLKQHNIVPTNYWEDVKGHRIDKRSSPHKALADAQVLALIDAAAQVGPTQALALTLIFSLGLRVSEFTAICIKDLSGDTLKITGKGNKSRYLHITPGLKSYILDYIRDHHGTVNVNENRPLSESGKSSSGKLNSTTVWRWFKTAAHIAKIDPDLVTCHVGRATAITKALDAGEGIRDVANFVGHNCIDTTMIYDSKRGTGTIKTASSISYSIKK